MDENKEETGLTEESQPLPAETDKEIETPETEADGPDMVFGLPRRTFHLVVVGYALGVIAVGLLGLAGLVDENTGTVLPGVLGAALGYLLAKYLDKRGAKDTPDGPK